MPKTASTTTDCDDYSTFSTGKIAPPSAPPPSSSDNSSFTRSTSRFDSLAGFHRWLAKEGRLHQAAPSNKPAACPAPTGSGESRQKTYLLEDMPWSPLNHWRNLTRDDDDEGPQQTKKGRRGCCGGRSGVRAVGYCCRRKRSSSRDRDVYVSPRYFEPWIWKGTTKKPHKYVPSSDDDDGDEGDGNVFTYLIVIAVIIFVLIFLFKHRDRMENLVKFGGQYLGTSDFSSVKVSVEGGVKDMIGTNFDDMSWKYEDPQEKDDDQSFESAVEENDPSVIKHIRNFEDQLKKKPSMFFPSVGGGESGRGKKTSSFLTNMRDQLQ